MGKILTISVAAYNVEKFIKNTLDSLIDEDIIDDLEILVVDDGGTDKTLDIAREYAERYPDSIFPIHKENGGYGSVINTTVRRATGKYFKQLDGDDWFVKENLKVFVDLLKKIDSDMVLTPVIFYNEKTGKSKARRPYGDFVEGKYNFDNTAFDGILSMHSSTIKTSILQKMNLLITENCFYTDVEFVYSVLPNTNSFYVFNTPVYIYRTGQNDNSMSIRGVQRHFQDHEIAFNRMVCLYNEIGKGEDLKKRMVLNRLTRIFVNRIIFFCLLNRSKEHFKELKSFGDRVKSDLPEVYDLAKTKSKFVKLLICSNYLLYPLFSILITAKKRFLG